MKSQLSTKELNKVKNSLPPNGIGDIAEKLGINPSTVSRSLNGLNKKNQVAVVKCALEIIQCHKQELKKLELEIKAID